jgi:phosphohistidine swiveling domain-containing protein
MIGYVSWLHAGGEPEAALIGGKAASLARLLRAGYAVPSGFAITVEAFRRFLDHNQGQLKDVTWPEDLRSEILRSYGELGADPVAVRSSATDEDSEGASFAGQHLTTLDVKDEAALLEAVRACWASLFEASALRYRSARASDAAFAMGVLVQRMIASETSGVLFTIDPVGRDPNIIALDAACGLGEALVSGRVTPDQIHISKEPLRIVRSKIQGDAAVISEEHALNLAKTAIEIEQLAGLPQDIEWAIAEKKTWILQSRPITKPQDDAEEQWVSEFDTETEPQTRWTTANIQEVMPGLLTPLTWSFLGEDFDRYTRVALARLGLVFQSKDPLVGTFYGRAVLNLSLAQEIGGQTGAADEHYYGEEERKGKAKIQPAMLLKMAIVIPKSLWCFARLERSMKALDVAEADAEQADAQVTLSEPSIEALIAMIEERTRQVRQTGAAHVLASIYNGAMFTILGKLTAKLLGDANGELAARLVKGLADLDSARPAYEMWDLAEIVRASKSLSKAFEAKNGAEIARSLEALTGPDVETFRARVTRFSAGHGHHGIAEMELSAHPWEEDLASVLAMIRNYLEASSDLSPRQIEGRCRADRETATKDAFSRLSLVTRPLLRYFLGKTHKWIPAREHSKSLLIRAMHRRRRVIRELARRLVASGHCTDPVDIYYLTKGEIVRLARNQLEPKAASALIARRRAEERKNRRIVLPENFSGRPKPERASLPVGAERMLTGIPVSRGVVTGRARVILDPRTDSTIEPGEVMVAPITDAGWTPLFPIAAGLVVDIGGALSHGSTVAREYGLPAVVNVKIGTRVIKTGDLITVDGGRGIVALPGASEENQP